MSAGSTIPYRRAQPPSRFLLAAVLGHFAGAYAYCIAPILFTALSDLRVEGLAALPPTSWARLGEGVAAGVAVIVFLAVWAAMMMVPLSLLTVPVTWLAERGLRTGFVPTLGLGATGGFLSAFVALREAPIRDAHLYDSAVSAGMAFAGTVWLVCIRPRRHVPDGC